MPLAIPLHSHPRIAPASRLSQGGAKNVSTKSDVWALGLVLSEICTARFPYGGDLEPVILQWLSGPNPGAEEIADLADLPDDAPGAFATCGAARPIVF
jgi:serine/threonine protein kinase